MHYLNLVREIWSVDSQENQYSCHKMSNFKAKMYQIRVPRGFAPDPARGLKAGREGQEDKRRIYVFAVPRAYTNLKTGLDFTVRNRMH